jgi:2-iminobutanoate/2-iminopropanoate deaminase
MDRRPLPYILSKLISTKHLYEPICLLAACLLIFCTNRLLAQENNIPKTKFHWNRDQDTSAGYAQAILVDNMLYISGSVGRGQTMTEQLKSLYSAIEKTLKNYGAPFQNIVKENLFATDIEAVKAANNEGRKPFYKGDYPAATWTQISRLYMSSAMVEVEVIAHLPKK